jgi:hypothetical protein
MRSFRPIPTFSLLLLGTLLLCSCAGHAAKRQMAKQKSSQDLPKPGDSKQAPAWQTRLGRVALVNRSLEFVLIDAGTSPVPEPGTRLRAYAGEEPSAELSVSVHQQRPFLIADILSGNPRVNDMVVPVRSNPSPDERGRGTRGESEPNNAPPGWEQRQRERPSAATEPISARPTTKGPSESQDLPQIERRLPPPPESLLSPNSIPKQESDGIIPGLPVPGKSPPR